MKEHFVIEEISSFFKEEGEPCDLGCTDSDVERLISFCESKYPEKGICIVKEWAIVDCDIDAIDRAKYLASGYQPSVLHTNCVVWDKLQRWSPGSFSSSTLLVSIEENCLFITKNTSYILVGKGHRKITAPALLYAILEGLSLYNRT